MSFEMDEDKTQQREEDKECPICKECMGTESYASGETREEPLVHRLVCKHAFHSNCLLMSFRASGTVSCPMCRGIEGTARSSTVQRNGFNITITETETDSESDSDPWVDMTTLLRPHRGLPVLQELRKTQQENAKAYHQLRDRLRAEKRKCINQALVSFRRDRRAEFRAVLERLKASALATYEAEKQSFINAEGSLAYDESMWRHAHELLGKGIQYKDEMSGRKQDPWNSAFWYA
jgi:hypothetical protein